MANQATAAQVAQGGVPHPAPEAEEIYRRWIQFLDDEFTRHHNPERRAEVVRDQLYQLYLGRPHGRNGLSMRRMAVCCTFRRPSMGRHVHRQLLRSELPNSTTIVPVTVYP